MKMTVILLDLISARHASNMCPCPDNNQISRNQNHEEIVNRHEPFVPICPSHSASGNETEVKIIEGLIVHFSVFKTYIHHVIADHRKKTVRLNQKNDASIQFVVALYCLL